MPFSLFASREPEHIIVAKAAYKAALITLRDQKQCNTATVKENYLRELLFETLHNLVVYFDKDHPEKLRKNKGDEKTITELKRDLDAKEYVPKTLYRLRVNLYYIKAGFKNRGLVHPTFAKILTLPFFKIECLWESEARDRKALEGEVSTLQKKESKLIAGEETTVEALNTEQEDVLEDAEEKALRMNRK